MNRIYQSNRLPLNRLDLNKLALGMFMALMITLFWAQNLWAEDKKVRLNETPEIQEEAAEFIKQLADKALTSLKNEEATLADQEIHFREILLEGFDVKYIGKISLGRHRKQATQENLDNYYDLFPKYLVKFYTSHLTKLDTREVHVGKILPIGKRDMFVRTKIIDGEDKSYDVDWRVRPQKSLNNANGDNADDATEKRHFKIIDVIIEGISMARTQRDSFTSRITESGVSGLIDFMQSIISGAVMVADNNKQQKTPKSKQDP